MLVMVSLISSRRLQRGGADLTRVKLNRLIDPIGRRPNRPRTENYYAGLLMFDSKHFFHPQRPVVRDTNWQIHPIFRIEYCPNDKTCRADSDENWVDLDNE